MNWCTTVWFYVNPPPPFQTIVHSATMAALPSSLFLAAPLPDGGEVDGAGVFAAMTRALLAPPSLPPPLPPPTPPLQAAVVVPQLPATPPPPPPRAPSPPPAAHPTTAGLRAGDGARAVALEAVWAVAAGSSDSLREALGALGVPMPWAGWPTPALADLAELADVRTAVEGAAERLAASGSLLQAGLADGAAELVDGLQEALVAVEARLRADGGLTDAWVRVALAPHAAALAPVAALLAEVVAGNLRGGALINLLYARTAAAGDASLQTHFARLLRAVHRPWFAHLAQWCAYGEHADAHAEFMVQPAFSTRSLRVAHHPAGGTSIDGGGGGGGGVGGAPVAAGALPVPQLIAEHDWYVGAALARHNIPSLYCADPVADDILLIGAAARLLRTPGRAGLDADAGGGGGGGGGGSGGVAADDELPHALDDTSGGGGEVLPPPRLSERDCIRIARYIGALRSSDAPFSPLAFEYVVAQVKAFVLRRLWALVVRRGDFFRHVAAMRDYLLLGRGDLYRAFVEAARPLFAATPATAPGALALLTSGPWRAAAGVAAIPLPAGGRDADGGAAGAGGSSGGSPLAGAGGGSLYNTDELFGRCFWALYHRAVRWWAPPPTLLAGVLGDDADMSTTGGGAAAGAGGGGSGGAGSRALSAWVPPAVADAAAVRAAHATGSFISVGSAGMVTVQVQHAGGGSGGGGDVSGAAESPARGVRGRLPPPAPGSDALWEHACLMLSAAGAPPDETGGGSAPTAGALWYHQPLAAARGFLLRARLHVHAPLFPTDAEGGAAGQTLSFGVVVQRHSALAVCHATPASTRATGAVPPSGGDDLPSALLLHVLAKRTRTTLASVGRPDGGSAGAAAAGGTPASATFRLVAALYGPLRPGATPGAGVAARPLLASGVVPEVTLPLQYTYLAPADGMVTAVFPLFLALEVTPPTPAPPGAPASAATPQRVVASVLQQPCEVGGGGGGRRDSIASAATTTSVSAGGGETRTVFDAPVGAGGALDFLSWRGPGRDRAWVGFTGDTVFAPRGCPAASLAAFDYVSYANVDDGYHGLTLGYAVPWPVHVVVTSGALALYHDIFRLLLRAKGASLALQDTWRTLMDSFSLSASTGAGMVVAPDAPLPPLPPAGGGGGGGGGAAGRRSRRPSTRSDDGSVASAGAAGGGVGRQVSGVGGKRSADPPVHARQRMRIAVHKLLQPVWLLRSQMAAVVDAILYHMQVDVVEAAWARLVAAAAGAPDFPALVRAHDAYVGELRARCFLGQVSVLSCIERLLQWCDAFNALVAGAAPNLAELLRPAGDRDAFLSIATAFKADTRFLLGLLAGAVHVAEAPSLVTRLNFSGYFS